MNSSNNSDSVGTWNSERVRESVNRVVGFLKLDEEMRPAVPRRALYDYRGITLHPDDIELIARAAEAYAYVVDHPDLYSDPSLDVIGAMMIEVFDGAVPGPRLAEIHNLMWERAKIRWPGLTHGQLEDMMWIQARRQIEALERMGL